MTREKRARDFLKEYVAQRGYLPMTEEDVVNMLVSFETLLRKLLAAKMAGYEKLVTED